MMVWPEERGWAHAIADGVAGVAALGELLDVDPHGRQVDAPPWTPATAPSNRELLRDNVLRHAAGLRRAARALAHPRATIAAGRRGWPALREAFGGEHVPRTSLTAAAIGWHRRLALVR